MIDLSKNAADWIQDNVYLIDEGDLQQLVKRCPATIVGEVLLAMDNVGAEIKEDPDSSDMWGIKRFDGYRTLSLGKHNNVNFNVNFTVSEGMRGGMQIGFKSVNDCIQFIKNLGNSAQKYRPSRMQPNTVAKYTWTEVDTIYGKCWVTNLAIEQYDPKIAADRTKLNKAIRKLNREWYAILTDKINLDLIQNELSGRYKDKSSSKGEFFKGKVILHCPYKIQKPGLSILNYILTNSDVADILKSIKKLTGLEPDIVSRSEDNARIYLRFDNDPEYIELKNKIFTEAGINP